MNSDSESSRSAAEDSSWSRSRPSSNTDRKKVSSRGNLQHSKYVPKTRVERLKQKAIPESSTSKLVVASNLEGNGFRWHERDIDRLLVDEQARNRIRSCIKEGERGSIVVNKTCYDVWNRKRTTEGTEGRLRISLLGALSGWIMLSMLLLSVGIQPTQLIDGIILGTSLLAVLAIAGLAVSAYCSQYSQDSLEVSIKNAIRQKIRSFNSLPYFVERKMRWRTTKDCFWLSLQIEGLEGAVLMVH